MGHTLLTEMLGLKIPAKLLNLTRMAIFHITAQAKTSRWAGSPTLQSGIGTAFMEVEAIFYISNGHFYKPL